MQTFLPSWDFQECARVLDRSRLAGQRKECVQLVYAVDPTARAGTPELIARKEHAALHSLFPKRGWSAHPAAVMWMGRPPALLAYLGAIDAEWKRRGYKSKLVIPEAGPVIMPSWMGRADLHASHRSNLLRKNPDHYSQFGWTEPPDLEYVWPGPCQIVAGVDTSSMSPS